MLRLSEAVKFLHSYLFYVNNSSASGGVNNINNNVAGGFGVGVTRNFSYYVFY